MGKLTALAVKAATKPGSYQDGEGLMLLVKPSGARSWQVRLQVDGKRRDFGLGSARTVSLGDAREKADGLRKLYRSGVDPVAQKRADKLVKATIPTFRVAAERTHGERKEGWSNGKHNAQWLASLESYVFPALGERRIDTIDAPMIRDVLLLFWLEKPETARRVRQRIVAIMDWAASNAFRPALDLSGISKGLPKQPKRDNHLKAMDYELVPAFMAEVRAANETVGRLALLFTILTAARSGETRGATWEEIDTEAAEWTIPGTRMKAGKEHRVPLSASALAVLERAKVLRAGIAGEPIFPGKDRKPVSDMTLSKVMRDMDLTDTVHGFRSAFKDWASVETTFPDAVSEAALAHIDPNKVRKAYRRTDFRKLRVDLMAAWGSYCDSHGAVEGNVVSINRA